jgi:hypothetical protein
MAAIELRIAMDAEGEPIAGFLSAGGEERAVRFAGWVELVRAIERVRASARAANDVTPSGVPATCALMKPEQQRGRHPDG